MAVRRQFGSSFSPSPPLVKGLSALDIIKESGELPSTAGPVEFSAWLRAPVDEAAAGVAEAAATFIAQYGDLGAALDDAAAAALAAQGFRDTAEGYATTATAQAALADDAASDATAQVALASGYATTASGAQAAAAGSATAAANSATAASGSATASANSATASAGSATASANSATASQASRLAAEAAQAAAEAARDDAEAISGFDVSEYLRKDDNLTGLTDVGAAKTTLGLNNVDNTSDAGKPVSTATQTALDLKAPLASPDLTGTPTAPTAAGGTDTTQLATTAYVRAEVVALDLGTAATADTGTAAGNVVVLDGSARLPAVDGSLLTNLTASASGLTTIATQSPTGVGVVEFISIPDIYSELIVIIDGISPSSVVGAPFLEWQASGDNLATATAATTLSSTASAASDTIFGVLQIPGYTEEWAYFRRHVANNPTASPSIVTTGTATSALIRVGGGINSLRFLWSAAVDFDGGSITLLGRA